MKVEFKLKAVVLAQAAACLGLVACGGADSGAGATEQQTEQAAGIGSLFTDSTAPTVSITSKTGGGTSAVAALVGTAADNMQVASVRWSNDRGGSGTASMSGSRKSVSWNAASIPLQTGTNTITVTALDSSGNSKGVSTTVAVADTSGGGGTGGGGTGGGGTTGSSSFDSFYATNFALKALAADPIPAVAKPAAKASSLSAASFIDPAYGTRVYKATDAADFPGASFVRHDYSRRQAFNADNSRYLGYVSNGYWILYDANTFKVLKRTGYNGALKGLAGDTEAIWHPTDPKKLWYTGNAGGLVWYEKNVETDVDTVMGDFRGRLPWPGATGVWTKAEGTSSADGRYFAFMATSYNSSTQTNIIHGLFTYDRLNDKIVGTLDGSKFGYAFPDHISISPSGKYAIPSWAYNKSLGTRAYPLDFSSSIQLHTQSEHSDLAIGPNGEDLYVVTDYDSGFVRAVNCATGASFNLMPLYPATGVSYAAHISGKAYGRPGWVAMSTYADFGNYGSYPDPQLKSMERKIMLLELKPGGRQLSVAHTRAAANYGGYWGEHQATISRDGSRLMFATNFNDGGLPNSYVIGLPSWIYK